MVLPETAIASYPRSGNTWMRVLLEASTAQRVMSVAMDQPYPQIAKGSSIAIKTHQTDRESALRYNQAVHLIRHPYDCIESFFHYHVDFDYGKRRTWEEHVQKCVHDWRYHTVYWQQHECRLLVRYEDMLEDTERELRRVLAFLGLEVGEDQVEYALSFTFEKLRESITNGDKFYRRGTSGDGRAAFSPAQLDWVYSQLADVVERYDYSL